MTESVQSACIPDQRLSEIREAMITDDTMQKLVKYTSEGWPENKCQVEAETGEIHLKDGQRTNAR